ncbi:MAG: hypothetical protein M1827_004118 [Pycnora praestabilis]|nr:MAG: hypothetical protein M1827_004118 [Pycnora praestabilis]
MASASSSVIPLGSLLTASGTPSISIAPTFQSTRATLTPLTAQTTTQVPVSPQSSTISPVAARSGSLSSPQIAGIAVSGVAAASLAMGLILFVGCLRRRRKVRQADDPPFEIEKTPPKPLTLPNCSSAAMTDPRLRDAASNTATIDFAARERAAPPVPPKTEPHRWSLWPRPSVKPHDIGVAISPEMTQAASPTSVASYRTVSKLLPDKPGLAFVPTSFQKSSSRESRRPESAVTEFEDDEDDMGKRSLDVITDLYAGHWPVERDLTPSPQPIGQTVEEPTKVEIVAKPKQAQRPQPAIRVPTALTAGGKLRNSVYLPPRMGDSSIYTDRSSLPPSEPRNSQYPSSNIPVANRRRSQKKAARYSNASDTSFETLGDDEDADTDHEGLSPVAESPIADVRYPKIPRSASSAQRPERQPSFSTKPVHPSITTPSTHLGARNANLPSASHSSQHDRSLKKGQTPSASSLLAKRRGDRAAAELEMRLKTRRDEEGARQYAARTGTDLDDFIKSPTARELTPTRRGDELFLAVR